MQKWKWLFFSFLGLFVVTNLFWVFTVVDMSVTQGYKQVSLDAKTKAITMLGTLIVQESRRYSKKDMLHILRRTYKDAFIVDEGNVIDVEGVRFVFVDGMLSRIEDQ